MIGLQNAAFVCVLLVCGLGTFLVVAQCGQCMSNGAQCINDSQFYSCSQGIPSTSLIFNCAENEVCTSTTDICVKRDEVVPTTVACGDKCNKCPESSENFNRFACVSNSQYALCSNNEPTTTVGSCDPGEYCNIDHYKKYGKICAPSCVINYFNYGSTCSNDVFITTAAPTVATQAPNQESLRQQCIVRKPSTPRTFYYVRNRDDSNCNTYIYCAEISNVMETVLLRCETGFYDEEVNRCLIDRPASCRPTVAPSTAAPITAGNPDETTTTEESSVAGNPEETTTTEESSAAGNPEEPNAPVNGE